MIRLGTAFLAALPLLIACGGGGGCGGGCNEPLPQLRVFAAASLQPAFSQIAIDLRNNRQIVANFNYAGTQTLTAQLQEGAQADVFASADTAHMTVLQRAGLLAEEPQVFAHNRLVIAVAKGNPQGIHALADLARRDLVVVLADPSVPAGKYAVQALAKAGVTVKPASLELQVTAVLSKVALGEADAGIVYVSDVKTNNHVDGVSIPDDQNVIADYLIAVLKSSHDSYAARKFVDLVVSSRGQSLLETAGFQPA